MCFLMTFKDVQCISKVLSMSFNCFSMIFNNPQTFCIVFEASWGRGSPHPGGHFRAIGRLRRLVHPVSTRNPPGLHGNFRGSTFGGGRPDPLGGTFGPLGAEAPLLRFGGWGRGPPQHWYPQRRLWSQPCFLYQTTPCLGKAAVRASALALIWNMKIQQKSIKNNEISTRWWTKGENY